MGDKESPQTGKSHTVRSRMAILQHPLHPILVIYPVAFLSVIVATDVLFLLLGDDFWARMSFLLSVTGLAAGVIAALVGMADFLLIREVRRHVSAWNHFISGVMVLALAAVNVGLRWSDAAAAIWPWGVVVSALMFVLVSITGWLGGTLSFKYGIGVYGQEEAAASGSDDSPPAG